ncbi:MAG: VCBS repeat-containing protein [Patescibacteria group bacterium]
MKKAIIIIILNFIILTPALASDDVIGLFGKYNKRYKFLDNQGALLSIKKIKKDRQQGLYRSSAFGELSETKGLEWVIPKAKKAKDDTYNDTYFDKKEIVILNQNNTKAIDEFTPFKKYNLGWILATVGDLYPEYEGDEIAVCRTHTVRPLIKIYSYSDEDGPELINSFKPFGKNTKNRRWCRDMDIGDVDGDGQNELVVSKYYSKKRIKVFSNDGNVKKIFNIKKTNPRSFKLADIDGDGREEMIFKDNYDIRAISYDGETILNVSSEDYDIEFFDRFDVGNIDQDEKDEIIFTEPIYRKGLFIIDDNGDVEYHFRYRTKIRRANRILLVGPFEY